MFGVQWDLVLRYLESKEVMQEYLKSDSTDWGNYSNNLWDITNVSAKYYSSSTWTEGAYGEKTSSSSILLSTGESDSFCKEGIYDLAGNVWEWTLSTKPDTSYSGVVRGGVYSDTGSGYSAKSVGNYINKKSGQENIGFRVTIF